MDNGSGLKFGYCGHSVPPLFFLADRLMEVDFSVAVLCGEIFGLFLFQELVNKAVPNQRAQEDCKVYF